MKRFLATAAILIALTGAAIAQGPLTLDRTQEYRMWSAEQMIDRLAKIVPNATTPSIKKSIREAAASGNDVLWAETIDIVHKLELDTARAENKAAREQREAKDEQNRLKSERQRARQYLDDLRWR